MPDRTALAALIDAQKAQSFTEPSKASDEDALGILISQHFEWDGHAIMRVARAALEDANFHIEAATIEGWINA